PELKIDPLPPTPSIPSHQTAQRVAANDPRRHPPLSPVQRNKLTELFKVLNGTNDEETATGLNNLFMDAWKVGTNEATYEQGARMTGQLLAALRSKQPA